MLMYFHSIAQSSISVSGGRVSILILLLAVNLRSISATPASMHALSSVGQDEWLN